MRCAALLLILLSIVAGRVCPAAEAPVRRTATGSMEIPLLITGGTLACRGSIDGRDGLLLIDSGSALTCLFPAQTHAHRYRYRKVQLVTATAAGPHRVSRVVRDASIHVGNCTYPAHDLVVLPDCGTEAIGLLGCDFLRATGARIDVARRMLVLTRAP